MIIISSTGSGHERKSSQFAALFLLSRPLPSSGAQASPRRRQSIDGSRAGRPRRRSSSPASAATMARARPARATKTDTASRDIPQALTVISEAAGRGPGAALGRRPAAVRPRRDPRHRREQSRPVHACAAITPPPTLFIDGVRDDAQYFRDFYNVERVEVLQGPQCDDLRPRRRRRNRQPRAQAPDLRPTPASSHRRSTSEGGVRLAGDVDHPSANGRSASRVNGMFEDGRQLPPPRQAAALRRSTRPLGVAAVGRDTRLDLGYEYFHDRRTADRGLPADGNRPLKGYDRTFFGDPDDSFAQGRRPCRHRARRHDLGDGLTLRNRTSVARYDKFYQNIYPHQPRRGDARSRARRLQQPQRPHQRLQPDRPGPRRADSPASTRPCSLGVEVGRQWSRNQRLTGHDRRRQPRAAGRSDGRCRRRSSPPSPSDANNRTRATIAAVYVQDQIRPASWLEIVAGLRFDQFKLEGRRSARRRAAGFSRRDTLLVAAPWPHPQADATICRSTAALSRSFLPQSGDQFSGLDINTADLKPERFDNFELGAKWEPVDGLLATAAIYQLDRNNTRAVDPPTRPASS